MKVRQILLTIAFSFLGGFSAVVILLHGLLPLSDAVCPQLEDTGKTPCGTGDANGDEKLDMADGIYILSWQFAQGPAPVASADSCERCLTEEQEEILSHLSLVTLDDGQGGTVKTIRITAANLQIINGLGTTQTTNGVGNLIVGYQENRTSSDWNPENNRTGSHNIVVGKKNNYSRFGGIVAGELNTISGNYSSVSGGTKNTAGNSYSSVSGGASNEAAGNYSSVSGGTKNFAGNFYSSVSGGSSNEALGSHSSISGGRYCTTMGEWTSVNGGYENEPSGPYSTVSGGNSVNVTQDYYTATGILQISR